MNNRLSSCNKTTFSFVCQWPRYSALLDSLIYTFVYVPILEMKKCGLRKFLLSSIFQLKGNHNTPSYEVHREDKRRIKTR